MNGDAFWAGFLNTLPGMLLAVAALVKVIVAEQRTIAAVQEVHAIVNSQREAMLKEIRELKDFIASGRVAGTLSMTGATPGDPGGIPPGGRA